MSMIKNWKASGELLFQALGVKLDDIPFEHLASYTAVHYFLTAENQPHANAQNLDKVTRYLESFHHLCAVSDWDLAYKIMFLPLESFDDNHLTLQLDIWGYYEKEISLGEQLLNKISPQVDLECLIVMGDGYIDLGDYEKAWKVYQQGLDLSHTINDSEMQITCLLCLGLVLNYQGKYRESAAYYQEALNQDIKLCDLKTEYLVLKARILSNLAMSYYNLDRNKESLDCNEQSLSLFRILGDRQGEATTLISLGRDYYILEDYERGLTLGQQGLTLAREIGHSSGEAEALNLLGMIYCATGDFQQALEVHEKQITIAREIGDLREEAYAMGNLADLYETLEDYDLSAHYAQKHLALSQQIGDRRGEGAALHSLGVALLEQSQLSRALEKLQLALQIFQEVESRSEEAQTLADLSVLYWRLNDNESALNYCDCAYVLAKKLDISLADECQELRQQILGS
ncbi:MULTISPECIES: tetratricopeptide repeat protein [Spirulina sp. CCY15215]|uniref:tetratricopeptide repeat protein n=1 Tax=Spirulina sp. CCY15215 TaxID=2767591 RepID=UPI00194F77E8|nr:tetratricopeptide repeat protein [Spirulina major]